MMDVKVLLKEAREAIKNKDYETSLKLSRNILKQDKCNYMALVFLGLSVQEIGPTDQAPRAFQKAIDIDSTNPLAWNGMINYYEKQSSCDSKKELVKLYTTAIAIETSEKKIIEYCEKLTKLYEYGDILQISEQVFKCSKGKNISKNIYIFEILVKLFGDIKEVPCELISMYEECLLHLISNKESLRIDYYSAYLTLLYKQNKNEELLKEAEKMHNLFKDDTVSLSWICKIYNQLYLENFELGEKYYDKVIQCYTKLLQMEPENAIALFTKSIMLIKQNEILASKDTLVQVTSLRPGILHVWILLTNIYIQLNLYEDAAQSFSTANRLLRSLRNPNKDIKNLFSKLSLEMLSKSHEEDDWYKALELYKNIDDTELKNDCLEYIIRVNINLEKFVEAKLNISDLRSSNEPTSRLLLAKSLHKQKKYEDALSLIEKDTVNSSEWWLEIGLLHWSLGEYRNCLAPFLKAAKYDPNNYICFFHLGNYYQKFDDFDKARRCYEKSFKINSKNSEVGTELCKIYRKLKNWEAVQVLLESLTTGPINKKKSWAWLQLGLCYLEQEEYSKAIDALQFVIRVDSDNVDCWESLADAYFARGSYTSALKCYQKSLELTKNTLYPSLQIANIKKVLAQYLEARMDFEKILLTNSQYVPALKGFAETCMYQAQECYKDQRLGTARDHAQISVEKITLAILQRSEFPCLWKLLGDICLFVAKLPEKYCCLLISKSVLEAKQLEGRSILEKDELYIFATRCYCKAVNLMADNILIWHDLGVCYLNHAINTDDPEKKKLLFIYAMAVARHCTSTNPNNWQHWNLMGNIAIVQSSPNYALAQHAYIKAVTADHNSTIAWCNLGVLYLLLDKILLANKAFAQGQRSDPNYVNSWIGQAMVAENLNHDEAMDLYRHSTQLGQHQEGGLGYARLVCKTLLKAPPNAVIYSIHNMHAIPVACDALIWYTEKNPYDACAWNTLGILKERMGLKEGTLQAFKNAYRLCQKEQRDLARVNYGRIIVKLGKFSDAIEIFQEVQEASFESVSGLAMAYFKNKQYEESYCAYEQALHWLTDDAGSQSNLLVALASMAYMFQGADAAKTLLFQSIQLKPPSPWSFYATLSLALLHNDLKLAKLVLNEMEILKDQQESLEHYAILLSVAYLVQGKPNDAIVGVSKLIHRYSNNPSIWLTLSVLLLRLHGQRKPSVAAAKCAQVAMKLGRTNTDVTKVMGLVSLASVLIGDTKQAIISAQKAVHCYPNVAGGWAVLCSALLTINRHPKILILKILQHIENLDPSDILLEWTRKHQVLCIK